MEINHGEMSEMVPRLVTRKVICVPPGLNEISRSSNQTMIHFLFTTQSAFLLMAKDFTDGQTLFIFQRGFLTDRLADLAWVTNLVASRISGIYQQHGNAFFAIFV